MASHRLRMAWVFASLPCLALGGCGAGDAGDATARAVVDTVAGVERIRYDAAPGPSLDWTVDTLVVLGDAMADDPYQFQPPGDAGLAGDPAGHVLVVDRQGTRVLEYGPEGRHVATHGRRGGGPGELSFPIDLDVGPGDTIWVNDLGNRRLTGYPRDGGEPRTVPYPEADVFPGGRIEALEDGFIQVRGAIGPPDRPIPEPLLRLDAGLKALDTLWVRPPEPMVLAEIEVDGGRLMLGLVPEFWPAFHWRALSDGQVVVADSADYVLRILGPRGDVRRIIRREPPARPTTDADREAVRDRIRRDADADGAAGEGGVARDRRRRIAEERLARLTFADRIPRIVDLAVDRADRIWVGVSEDSTDVVQRIDLYDDGGVLLGELRGVPMPLAFAGADRILRFRRDELDVPQIVVLRLEGMTRAATGQLLSRDRR